MLGGRLVAVVGVALTLNACGPSGAGSGAGGGGSGAKGGNAAGKDGGGGGGVAGAAGTGTGAAASSGGVGGSSLGGAGAGAGTGIGGTMSCGQTTVTLVLQPVDILIVQDKSLSMVQQPNGCCCGTAQTGCTPGDVCNGNTACGAMSKWSQVSAAIDMVVMATQASVNWGLVFFGSDNMCGVNAQPNVPIALNNYTAISQAYANNQPASYTPTDAAVTAAVAYMRTLQDNNPKYLLLATDGLPNCMSGDSTADDSPGTVTAVANAEAAGFPVFVIGIGNTMGTATLNMLAIAGGEPQIGSADGNSFYEVNSTADLQAALNEIVKRATSCTIPLASVTGKLDKVAVSASDSHGNRVEIVQDSTNGWSYTDATMTSIVLAGTACANLQDGSYSDLQFIYTCSTGTICINGMPDGGC